LGAGLHGGEGAGEGGVGKDLGEELLGLEERGIVVRYCWYRRVCWSH